MRNLESLTRDYRVAFLRYLPGRSETALALGYEIGRAAVVEGVSVLHLAQVHHTVLSELMADTPQEGLRHLVTAAGEFFLEVLATVEMAQRGRPGQP